MNRTVDAIATAQAAATKWARKDGGRALSTGLSVTSLASSFVAMAVPVPQVKVVGAAVALGSGVLATGIDCMAEIVSVGCIAGLSGTAIGLTSLGRGAALLGRPEVEAFIWNGELIGFVVGLGG